MTLKIGHFHLLVGIIDDNKVFGRGAIDDKGPIIASLYAMKFIMDNYTLNKRVRLILGLDEERDWKCINYYKKYEEIPSISFSPDADFPCIYAEKSIITCYLNMPYLDLFNENIILKKIDCYNNPINVVPKQCSVTLKINHNKFLMHDLISVLQDIISLYNYEIDIYKVDETDIKLTSYGVSSHAAHPDLGINAISRLILVLNKLFNYYNIHIEIFEFFEKYLNTQYNGENLELNIEDFSGKLTLNVADLNLEDNTLKIGMNIRIPVSFTIEEIINIFTRYTNYYPSIEFKTIKHIPSLFLPKDDYLVQTLCSIYNEETNSNLTPITIGGATFARAFKNCISFGPNLPNHMDMCHQTNEFIDIDNLLLSCKLYTKAILELFKKPTDFIS